MELKDKAPPSWRWGALTVDPGPLPDAGVIRDARPHSPRAPARTPDQGAQATADALSALGNLGYGPSEAARAVAGPPARNRFHAGVDPRGPAAAGPRGVTAMPGNIRTFIPDGPP